MSSETCYSCDQPATSRDHVPPLCFFPDPREFPGIDYRRNLITVPSCDAHNLRLSQNDEYLRAVIASHVGNNKIAQDLYTTKVKRSLIRKPHLVQLFLKNARSVIFGGLPTGSFDVEIERFVIGMQKIAQGVYFHHFNRSWSVPGIDPVSLIRYGNPQAPEQIAAEQIIRQRARTVFTKAERHGANPSIFYYQIDHWVSEEHGRSSTMIHLNFYEGFSVLALALEPLLADSIS